MNLSKYNQELLISQVSEEIDKQVELYIEHFDLDEDQKASFPLTFVTSLQQKYYKIDVNVNIVFGEYTSDLLINEIDKSEYSDIKFYYNRN